MGVNELPQSVIDDMVDCVVIDMDQGGHIVATPKGICPIPHYSVLMDSLRPYSEKLLAKSPEEVSEVIRTPFRTTAEEKAVIAEFVAELNRFHRTLLVAILSNIRNFDSNTNLAAKEPGSAPVNICDERRVAQIAAKIEEGDEVSSRFYARLLLSQHFQFYYEKVHLHL